MENGLLMATREYPWVAWFLAFGFNGLVTSDGLRMLRKDWTPAGRDVAGHLHAAGGTGVYADGGNSRGRASGLTAVSGRPTVSATGGL